MLKTTLLLLALLLPIFAGSPSFSDIDEIKRKFKIAFDQTALIENHGVCRYVTNKSQNPLMVPVYTPQEWYSGPQSFLAAPRKDTIVTSCLCTTSCGVCGDPTIPYCINDPKNTLVTLLLDKSGSMAPYSEIVPEGVNIIIDNIQASIQAVKSAKNIDVRFEMNLIYFDAARITSILTARDLSSYGDYTGSTYSPTGGTRLYGGIIDSVAIVKSQMSSRPGWRSVFIVLSDGEDTGRGLTSTDANIALASLAASGTQLMYLGALNDATNTISEMVSIAQSLGFQDDKTIVFDTDYTNYTGVLGAAGVNAAAYGTGGVSSIAWDAVQREELRTHLPPSLAQ